MNEFDWNFFWENQAGLYGDNKQRLQQKKTATEKWSPAPAEKEYGFDLSSSEAEESHPIDVKAILGLDIEPNVEKMAELCEEPQIEEPDETTLNCLSPEEVSQFHPVQATILKLLKEKLASGVDPKEAFVKNGDIRQIFPDVSRMIITKHFNVLIKAKFIKRVDRIKYYLHFKTINK